MAKTYLNAHEMGAYLRSAGYTVGFPPGTEDRSKVLIKMKYSYGYQFLPLNQVEEALAEILLAKAEGLELTASQQFSLRVLQELNLVQTFKDLSNLITKEAGKNADADEASMD